MKILSQTVRELSEIVGGTIEGAEDAVVEGVCVDSRHCRVGELFVALRGEHSDGHRFVGAAWEAGAAAALVRYEAELENPPMGRALLRVSDPLSSLQEMSRLWRERFPALRVVGITGSNGKTTTKEMLASILHVWMGEAVLATPGNLNSEIGLPLTVLGLCERHRTAVLEMGMNRVGEMDLLASIARPDIAVVTNVGTAHVGPLGSREAVAAEKRKIFSLAGPGTVAVLPEEDDWREFLLEGFPGRVVTFGEGVSEGYEGAEDLGLEGQILHLKGRKLRLGLPGRHNRLNALAAAAAAGVLGAPDEAIHTGLELVRPSFGRSEVIRGPVTVILDCYNANPASLEAALHVFAAADAAGRRVVVLGEMLELGDETEDSLRSAGRMAAAAGPDALFLYGSSMAPAEHGALDSGFSGLIESYDDFEILEKRLSDYLAPGDLLLLKGSRGSALERVTAGMRSVGVG